MASYSFENCNKSIQSVNQTSDFARKVVFPSHLNKNQFIDQGHRLPENGCVVKNAVLQKTG